MVAAVAAAVMVAAVTEAAVVAMDTVVVATEVGENRFALLTYAIDANSQF